MPSRWRLIPETQQSLSEGSGTASFRLSPAVEVEADAAFFPASWRTEAMPLDFLTITAWGVTK